MARKLHIKTFGCQMNVYDSARMADVLAPLGYAATERADDADLVVLNTCHIREKAAEKLYSELGRIRRSKEARAAEGKTAMIAVAGCVAQAEGAEILSRAPYVDMVVGPQSYHRLPQLIAEAARRDPSNPSGVVDVEFPAEPKFDHLPPVRHRGPSAFLSVQEGCDKFCTFCVVPYTRGAEFSRPVKDVLDEARRVVDHGALEITLLGQNVNAYHGDAGGGAEAGLGGLIRRLAEIDGLKRIRYTTSHPRDMSDDLIAAHGEVEALMPFLHLPVQSGSDRVLAAMNRRHTRDDYRRIVDKLMAARPDLKLSSDFIVGFPGETGEDFDETVALARETRFIQAYSFKYSTRPGTPGAAMPNQIDESVKAERLSELQAVLDQNQIVFNRSSIGRKMAVLLDRPGRKAGQFAGRSVYMQPVHVDAPAHYFGRIAELEITDAHANSLSARLAGEEGGNGSHMERAFA